MMRCIHCESSETTFAFPYHWRWYRSWRQQTKLRCPECGMVWYTPYP